MQNSGSLRLISIALALATLCSGCSFLPRFNKKLPGDREYIRSWPADPNSDRLRLAVKDNIDMKGVVTTAGSEFFLKAHKPAKEDAPCLKIARQRGVQIVGKTNMTEFAVSPSGLNEYFGTPRNPLKRELIPGGSSSGSAVAVANGSADVAFGTDTAGSIRVPAACCGVVGLKTTHGLVSLKGVYPLEPEHLDTVGPLAKDIDHAVKGMELLVEGFAGRYATAKARHPTAQSIRVGRLRLRGTNPNVDAAIDDALARAGFKIVQLDDKFRVQWAQAKADGNTIAATGAWISDKHYQFALGVTARTKSAIRLGQVTSATAYRGAVARQPAWQRTLANVFKKVDFIALPTLQSTPPPIPLINLRIGILEALVLQLQNTVAVNFAGNPALAVPVPLQNSDVPVTSLELVGPRQSEADLLNAGRFVEEGVKTR